MRLIGPKFVARYRRSGMRGKTDAADTVAICEALQIPNRRFVSGKTPDQQALQTLHRVRQGFIDGAPHNTAGERQRVGG